MSFEQKEVLFKAKPLLALFCMGLSYGLVGWYCSALDAVWNAGSWLMAMALTFFLIWGWNIVVRIVLLSPRILVLILVLSMTLTIAVSFSTLFILIIMLLASTLFSKLELQTAGVNRVWTLIIISVVSGAMIGGGWTVGNYLYHQGPEESRMEIDQLKESSLLTKKLPERGSFRKLFADGFLTESDRSLPNKGEQQEEYGNNRHDVD